MSNVCDGVDDTELNNDDKVDVVNALTDVQFRYHEIGTQLHLKALETIKFRSPTDTIAMGAIIEEWLKGNYNIVKCGSPSWKKLVEVVANPNGGNNKFLAKKIADDHKKKSTISPKPVSIPKPTGFPEAEPIRLQKPLANSDNHLPPPEIGEKDPNYFNETSKIVKEVDMEADGFKKFQRYHSLSSYTTTDIKFSFGSIRPQQGNMTKGMATNYEMNRWPHGIAVIINNETFDDSKKREGTEKDEENLVQLFLFLGYIVEVHRDCKAQEIRAVMKEMGGRNHLEYDSFVCCILSHGTDGKIYGTDEIPVSLYDITTELKGEALANKPKMFFVQACRGSTLGKGIATDDGSERIGCDSIPDECDFYFGYATPRGHVALRNCEEGSWFISELCRSFASYARFTNLNDLMMITNDKVAIGYEYKGAKQAIEVTTRLRRNVFFFFSD